MASCFVCAAARARSFTEVSVFVAAVGGVAAVFFFPGGDLVSFLVVFRDGTVDWSTVDCIP